MRRSIDWGRNDGGGGSGGLVLDDGLTREGATFCAVAKEATPRCADTTAIERTVESFKSTSMSWETRFA
jgi:hypothetical protein